MPKYIYTDKSCYFFTKGKEYEIYPFNKKFQVEADDDGDHHGLSATQLNKWFKPVVEKEVTNG